MRALLFSCALAFLATTGCATTDGAPAASRPMPTGPATLPPRGFVDFCKRHPGECIEVALSEAPAVLDESRWGQLRQVNDAVNRAFPYVPDAGPSGRGDYWALPTVEGDCEDLALEKRRRLIALGWPPEALLIALARVPRLGGHAVLVVVTDQGDYVLDSREGAVRPWDELPYRWMRRQSPKNPRVWVRLQA